MTGGAEFQPLRLTLRNDLTELARVADAVRLFLLGAGIDEARIHRTLVVLEELLANAIQHGCSDGREHDITVAIAAPTSIVTLTIRDDGRPFDPVSAPAFDPATPLAQRSAGGMGIHLVRSLARELRYSRCDGHNVVDVVL